MFLRMLSIIFLLLLIACSTEKSRIKDELEDTYERIMDIKLELFFPKEYPSAYDLYGGSIRDTLIMIQRDFINSMDYNYNSVLASSDRVRNREAWVDYWYNTGMLTNEDKEMIKWNVLNWTNIEYLNKNFKYIYEYNVDSIYFSSNYYSSELLRIALKPYKKLYDSMGIAMDNATRLEITLLKLENVKR
jgi:hypothetical protein